MADMTIETDFLNTDFLLITFASILSIINFGFTLDFITKKDSTKRQHHHLTFPLKKVEDTLSISSKCFTLALAKIYHTRRQMRVEKINMFRV
ncbi:hypothetical protein ACIFQM_01615 [Paenibacillus sp. NRS-1782]|uniref:hypothetical protein n=1 Tax=unclassified Paenibacillus TaxID=185978 RepID=UPI003D2C609F